MLIFKGANVDESVTQIQTINLDTINKKNEKFISQENIDQLLILVPTKRKQRELQKEIVKKSISPVLEKINIETIETFAGELLKQTEKPFRMIGDSVATILIKESFEKVKSGLEYFPQDELPAGTLRSLRNIIEEYKRHPITPENLLAESEKKEKGEFLLSESERKKTRDIAKIYQAYNEECTSVNLKEVGDVYSDLVEIKENFEKYFEKCYSKVKTIYISGYNNFTNLEIELLDKLAQITNVVIEFNYCGDNEFLFGHLTGLYEKFTKEKSGWKTDELKHDHLNPVQSYISINYNKVPEQQQLPDRKIYKLEAADREKEVEFIAKAIKEMTEKGRKPHNICVVFNKIENYSALVRDKFTEYKIPLNLTDRKMLINSHPVQALMNFLEIKNNDFYYKDIMRAFSSGFISLKNKSYPYEIKSKDEKSDSKKYYQKVDCNIIFNAAKELKIVSGFTNWDFEIKQKLKDLQNQKENLNEENSIEKINYQINNYQKALSDLQVIHNSFEKFKNELTPAEFKNAINGLIEELNLDYLTLGRFKKYDLKDKDLEQDNFNYENLEENARGYIKFLEVLDELMDLIAEVEKNNKNNFDHYFNQLKIALKNQRFNLVEKTNYGVLVTTLDEIRELKFDYLFIGGLVDGDLPTSYSPPIFKAKTYTKKDDEHQAEERYLFYQTLCAWNRKVILSYPKNEEKREFEKSIFLKELENTLKITDFNKEIFKDKVYSKNELMKEFNKISNVSEVIDKINLSEDEIECALNVDKIREQQKYAATTFTGNLIDEVLQESQNEAEQNPANNDAQQIINEIYAKIPNERKVNFDEKLISTHKEKVEQITFSASQLEVFAKCPFKYFSEKIIRLKALEEPTDEMERTELGSLLHEILKDFYGNYCKNNPGQKLKKDKIKNYWEEIKSIAEIKIKEKFKSENDFIEREKILGMNKNYKDSILYQFLKLECEEKYEYEKVYNNEFAKLNFVPFAFEYEFGKRANKVFEIGGINLTGSVDRIDIDRNAKMFRVVDYKLSGKSVSKNDITEGKYLQLSIYLVAAQKYLLEVFGENFEPFAACIYSLKLKEEEFKVTPAIELFKRDQRSDKVKPDVAIQALKEKLPEFFNKINNAKFALPEKVDEKVCKYCNFINICRN